MQTPAPSVVLATYNGALYLPEFLASLARQTRRPGVLVVRDDGSRDQSLDIVRQWAHREGVALTLLQGERLGPARSFLAALRASPAGRVHFLADQDDVWLPQKIQRGLAMLEAASENEPTLYASRMSIVDQHLRPIRPSVSPRHLSFGSAACESVLTGCTMALNEPLRLLAVRADPRDVVMHDWWLYLLATGTGRILFDETPTILYRQHAANALGAGPAGWKQFVQRLKEYFRRTGIRSNQLREFLAIYEHTIAPEASALAHGLLAAKHRRALRWRVALTAPIERQRWFDRIATRFTILANRF